MLEGMLRFRVAVVVVTLVALIGTGFLGRFLVIQQGYLESVDYAPGRLVTITGQFTDTREGEVGSADYVYPVIEAEQIFLWSNNVGANQPTVHFGFGFIFSN